MLKKFQLLSLFVLYFACFAAWGFTYVNVSKYEPDPNDDYHNDFVLLKLWKTHPSVDVNGICSSDYHYYTAVEMDIFYGRPIDVKIPKKEGSDNRYCFEIPLCAFGNRI